MSVLLALLLSLQEPQRVFATWDAWVVENKSSLDDFKDLVDWLAKHEFDALLVRGPVELRELARYAKPKGVAVLAGLEVPDTLCPAKPEGREALRKSLEALRDADVDGAHLDVAPPTCGCAEHLSVSGTLAHDILKPRRVSYTAAGAVEPLKLLPEACVAEWTSLAGSPVKNNRLKLDAGGWGHPFRRREARGLSRGFNPSLEEIRAFAAAAKASGATSLTFGRGASPKSPDAELAALAFIDFARDPALTLEAFLKRHVPRLYGEAAAEDVVRLLLAQPAVHAKAAPFWKAYDAPKGDAKDVAAALAAQLALAKGAAAKASADGKRRLDAIARILDEYRIICEAAGLEKAKLAEAYEKAGLPDDIYGYKAWK